MDDAAFVRAKGLTIPTALALTTRLNVNVCAIFKGFLFVTHVTNRVSHEEVCFPSFDVLNCWLTYVTSCLDDANELQLKLITSFSAINSFNGSPQLGDICLLVQGLFYLLCT